MVGCAHLNLGGCGCCGGGECCGDDGSYRVGDAEVTGDDKALLLIRVFFLLLLLTVVVIYHTLCADISCTIGDGASGEDPDSCPPVGQSL